jgi:hypothetical protein
MRSQDQCTSTSGSTPSQPLPTIFSPEFLALLRDRDEVLTAAEAEYSGPWKREPVAGRPGMVAVVREWESVDLGDMPEGVFVHEETAALFAALLPVGEREPLFHLAGEAEAEGFSLLAVYGEQGPCVIGWLRRGEPRLAEGLHLLEGIVRSPAALALLLEAAGPIALEQAGQIVARQGTFGAV